MPSTTDYGSIQGVKLSQPASKAPLHPAGDSGADAPPSASTALSNGDGESNASPVVGWDVVAHPCPNSYPLLFRASPWRLLLRDLRFVVRHANLIPWMFLPLKKGKDISPIGVLAQVVFLLGSLVVTAIVISGAITGFPPFIVALLILLAFCKAANWVQGKKVRQSKGTATIANASKEAWFFVNGVATTGTAAQNIVTHLQDLFHRPVTAVLNRSYGLLFDLIECIVQRDLLYITSDIRVGYNPVRRAILDPSKERVVIIAHSQGGIIASAWVDQLLSDFPNASLAKVEIYTFASAANHFSRPATDKDGKGQPFAHVEHFANENDFVARFGVLGNAPGPNEEDEGDDPQPRIAPISRKLDAAHDLPRARGDYAGRIFCRHDSILDDAYVRQHSRLVKYLGGGEAL